MNLLGDSSLDFCKRTTEAVAPARCPGWDCECMATLRQLPWEMRATNSGDLAPVDELAKL
jgi:hypothetical protein